MTEIELTPDPHLLESMRAVGYSLETAVADIIDNSIAADASAIHLLSSPGGPFRVSIFDDGAGMDRAGAIEAMRLAARSPSETRNANDLGRFGLGLKTASLSQCRRLTIATKRAGFQTVLRWDLDHVLQTGRWLLQEVPKDEAEQLLGWNLLCEVDGGTLVAWEVLDRLTRTEGSAQADFDAAMARTRDHCELVFHRFICGVDRQLVTMTLNGNELQALDPFLSKNRATQAKRVPLRVGNDELSLVAYTLPFLGKLSAADKRKATAPGTLRDSQGFYIYRGGRLVVWGTWFRLNPKSEMGKLARVRVDVPNSLDHLWALDIKKSAATPPKELREALRQLSTQFVKPSRSVHEFRGVTPRSGGDVKRAWCLVLDRDDHFRYEVNRDYPLVEEFSRRLDAEMLQEFESILEMLEQTFPVLDAHNRLSQDGVSSQMASTLELAVRQAIAIRHMFATTHPEEDKFVELLLSMEPFASAIGFEDEYRKAISLSS